MKNLIGVLLGFIVLGCGNEHMPLNEVASISVPDPTVSSAPDITSYAKDIKPLFEKKCGMCHNASSSIPNWLSYDVAAAKKDVIYTRVVEKKDMPMYAKMSDDERALVGKWVKDGAQP